MKLLILAGGKGTRLKSAVPDFPKVLAPIDKIPFVDLQMKNWLSQGVSSFVFILHHEALMIKSHIVSKYPNLVKMEKIKFVTEQFPLDTGGAVSNAVKELNISGKFLVTNADTWLGSGLHDLWKSDSPSLGIIRVPDIARFGKVIFKSNKVIAFEEKNNKSEEGFINAGIFLFDAINFDTWDQETFSLERDFLPTLVYNKQLSFVKLNTDFIDIGIPSDYNRFCNWVKSNYNTKL
tara:strand:- start:454 stop:1158 length:705 start_codon:yes stop_codon:yes gene_type:complete